MTHRSWIDRDRACDSLAVRVNLDYIMQHGHTSRRQGTLDLPVLVREVFLGVVVACGRCEAQD